MAALFNPSPLVLGTLQTLSLTLDRSTALGRLPSVAALSVSRSEARAFGGLDIDLARFGKSSPAKVRYGAITVAPRAQGSAFSRSPGVSQAVDRAYDNPGVRFGDKVTHHERPTSSSGETSCHFSQTSVSKTSPIREMIKAARGGRRLTGSRAAAHVLYVEREGAPEKIRKPGLERLNGEEFTAEIERRGLGRSAVAQQAYIERGDAVEGLERKPGRTITDDELDVLDDASFGTIGDTVEERTQFWLAVEDAEASPKGDRITVKPAENPAWWTKVAEQVDEAPPAAQKILRQALGRATDEPFDLKLPTDKAFAFHQWAVALDTEAPLEISPGRGGRTQTRIIAELPHELDGRERLQIVRDFTDKLAEKGFPFWAVIHAPDANNDARNYHVHIAYYDRPSTKIKSPNKSDEVWDFEIQEERRYPNRTKYLVRPHQQNRDRATNDQDWVTQLRTHWETVSNRVLEEAGVSKRYNLGTYESMGIDLEPTKHINSRTFNKERKGELTEEGPVLARRQWDNVHERLVKDNEDRTRKRDKHVEGMADYAARLARTMPGFERRLGEIEKLKGLGKKANLQLGLVELNLDLTRLVVDRVASRPKLMMHAADKEEAKTRKKQKIPADTPPRDFEVAGAEMFGLRRRGEVARFLSEIYDQALKLDTENTARAKIAQSNLRLVIQELKERIKDPAYPSPGQRTHAYSVIHDLDSEEREKSRAVRIEAMQQQFRESVEAKFTQVAEALTAKFEEAKGAAAPQAKAKRQAAPTSPAPPVRIPPKPQYRAGRRDDTRLRAEPAKPAPRLPEGYGPPKRGTGAPSPAGLPIKHEQALAQQKAARSDETKSISSTTASSTEGSAPTPRNVPTSLVAEKLQTPHPHNRKQVAAPTALPDPIPNILKNYDTNTVPIDIGPTVPADCSYASPPVGMPPPTSANDGQRAATATKIHEKSMEANTGALLEAPSSPSASNQKRSSSGTTSSLQRYQSEELEVPSLAEIMESRDLKQPKITSPKVELTKLSASVQGSVGPAILEGTELKIVGAKRPDKKLKTRNRGREI